MKGFGRFGVTTVARWMTEPLPKGIKAYMRSQGRLFRLKRIRSRNAHIQAVFAGAVGGEFISRSVYALDSIVFLSLNVDLTKLAIKEILDAASPACSNCWALQDEAVRASALDEREALQQVAADRGIPASAVPWYG